MSSKARRPSFSPADQRTLLGLMRDARHLATLASGSERPRTPLHSAATAFQKATDDLAGVLTGDPELFWAKPHGIKLW